MFSPKATPYERKKLREIKIVRTTIVFITINTYNVKRDNCITTVGTP